jgi:hypothetical protein
MVPHGPFLTLMVHVLVRFLVLCVATADLHCYLDFFLCDVI